MDLANLYGHKRYSQHHSDNVSLSATHLSSILVQNAIEELIGSVMRGWFSDGSNGALSMSGNVGLASDVSYTTADTSSFTLSNNCFRIMATTSVTVNNGGKISGNGGDASGTTGGTISGPNSLGTGSAGANGNNTGAAGSNSTAVTNALGGRGGNGGRAHNGTSFTSAAGTSGTVSAPGAVYGTQQVLPVIVTGHLLHAGTSSLPTLVRSGTGGGSGGGHAAGYPSGSGGGSGHLIVISTKELIIVGTGAIESKGGAGSNGDGTSAVGEGSGGGGGGGGGVVFIYTKVPTVYVPIVTGGAAGLKTPNSMAEDGVAGSSGSYIVMAA